MLIWLPGIIVFFLLLLIPLAFISSRLRAIYQYYFSSMRRERLFLSAVSFFATFAIARTVAYSIYIDVGPFNSLFIAGKHIHHLVWGILLILFVGYLWLLQVGTGMATASKWIARVTAMLYGIGAALTLDEFALWLNLKDVYWQHEGRVSIDAVTLFGSLLAISLLGKPFFVGLVNELMRLLRR